MASGLGLKSMKHQIEALQAEIRRLIERLDTAESLLQEAAAFCPRRPRETMTHGPQLAAQRDNDLGNRIDDFLSQKS
jgi:hypothetical protein